MEWWDYNGWPSRAGEWEGGPARGTNQYDQIDFHLDLGCGRLPKGRIGVDRYPAPGVAVVADLDSLRTFAIPPEAGVEGWAPDPATGGFICHHHRDFVNGGKPLRYQPGSELYSVEQGRLPFPDSSIESVISHHFFEHVGAGFIPLVDEIYRVLKPDGILRAITPLFPSWSAVSDPDHKRYFMADESGSNTWDTFCGTPGADDDSSSCWLASFSVPYTKARFERLHVDFTPTVPALDQWTSRDSRELRVALRAVKAA